MALLLIVLCSCLFSGGSQGDSPTAAKAAPDQIKTVSPQQLKDWTTTGQSVTVIDIREDDEWQTGHVPTALHIPRWTLSGRIGAVVPDKSARIVLYCKTGVRSAAYAGTLRRLGYTNVFSLAGGLKSYQLAGLPVLEGLR